MFTVLGAFSGYSSAVMTLPSSMVMVTVGWLDIWFCSFLGARFFRAQSDAAGTQERRSSPGPSGPAAENPRIHRFSNALAVDDIVIRQKVHELGTKIVPGTELRHGLALVVI